jgi:VanZ family protein
MTSTGRPSRWRWVLGALAIGAVIVVAALLLWPDSVDDPLVELIDTLFPPPPGAGPHSLLLPMAQFSANVVLFLPIGFLLVIATRRWWVGMLIGVALSTACESVQALLPGRVSSIDDIVANTIGAIAGSVVAAVVLFLGGAREDRTPTALGPDTAA